MLSPTLLRKALRWYASGKWHTGSEEALPARWSEVFDGPHGSAAFALSVARFQAAHGLTPDGIVGPRTHVLLDRLFGSPGVRGGRTDRLHFAGVEVPVPGVRVINAWDTERGFDFGTARPGAHGHGQVRGLRYGSIVLHDSVTFTGRACFDVLVRRSSRHTGRNLGLGTHIILDADGTAYQCVQDLAIVTWHATGWSRSAVGLDIVCPLDPRLVPRRPAHPCLHAGTAWAPDGYLDYTDAQKAALPALVRALCDLCGIPFAWPTDADGGPATRPYGQVVDGLRPGSHGVVAHGQISAARWDGNRALEILAGLG